MNAPVSIPALGNVVVSALLMAVPLRGAPAEFVAPPINVADGFEVSLAAAPPLVGYPMMACFDDRGRLYIAESDGRNLTTKAEIEKELPRFVRRLVDTDGDGVFDVSTIFADRMTMPEGGLWHNGALYIISAPYLWRLEDVDGDGVADKREKILGYMEFDGRANQHGPYLGPNGRFYFTGGHFGFEFVGTDRSRTGKSRAAGVFSCWPDGSDVRVEGQGGVNPVDIVFSENGEMISTCAIFDSFGGRHDALVHWIRGGLTQRVYGAAVVPETGYRLPAMTRWGQVAPAGLARYRSEQFGDGYMGTLFACHFNTRALVHVRPVQSGATFTTEDSDFLTSTSTDFHPADVLEDADGSVLLLDTGGWLSWGCPHSKLAKPEVKGAIYRIRKKGSAPITDPRGLNIDWDEAEVAEITALLADSRPAVRDRARETLVGRGDPVVQAVSAAFERAGSQAERKRCLWVLSRIASGAARAALREALEDPDSGVRQVAARSVGMLQDIDAAPGLRKLLGDGSTAVRRAAATALGQIGARSAVADIFRTLEPNTELYLQHAATYALIEIGDTEATSTYLEDDGNPHLQKTALRVLDQLGGNELELSMIIPLLDSEDRALRDEARRVIASQARWRETIVQVFEVMLREQDPDATLIEGIVLAFPGDAMTHEVIARALSADATAGAVKLRLLRSIGFLDALPEALHGPLGHALSSPALRGEALALLQRFNPPVELHAPLRKLANQKEEPREVRAGAIAALMENGLEVGEDSHAFLIDIVRDPESPPLLGLQAARTLGSQHPPQLTWQRLQAICGLFEWASPLEIPQLLPAVLQFSVSPEPAGSESSFTQQELKLVPVHLGAALKRRSTGAGSLERTQVAEILSAYPPSITVPDVDLSAILETDADTPAAHESKLKQLLADLPPGNASRGRVLFHTDRATCALCHRVQRNGGTLGPDLSQIGKIRSRRDLIEAIAFPSATVVNGYENYMVDTDDGTTHAGLIQSETPDAVYLRGADQREIRVDRDKIAAMQRSPVSAMPAALDQIFSKDDLADLVAFLESCQ